MHTEYPTIKEKAATRNYEQDVSLLTDLLIRDMRGGRDRGQGGDPFPAPRTRMTRSSSSGSSVFTPTLSRSTQETNRSKMNVKCYRIYVNPGYTIILYLFHMGLPFLPPPPPPRRADVSINHPQELSPSLEPQE